MELFLGERDMNESANRRLSKCLRTAATAMLVSASAAASTLAYAGEREKPIVVEPTSLPALARQPGQAMFLREADDGRTFLYVEQGQGSRLAVFNVTNPARIKGVGEVQLDVPGPFDFVSALGSAAEVIRFRENQAEAVLDLRKANAPVLKIDERHAVLLSANDAMPRGRPVRNAPS